MRHIGKKLALEAIRFLDEAILLLQCFLLGHITNGTDDMRHLIEQQGPQTDIHGKFCAILAPPGELQPGSHGTSEWGREIALPMSNMGFSKAVGEEDFEPLTQEFRTC